MPLLRLARLIALNISGLPYALAQFLEASVYGPGGGPKMTRTLPMVGGFLLIVLLALASVVLMPRGGAPDIYLSAPDWQASQPVQPAAPAAPVVDSAQAAVAVQAPVWASDPYLGYGQGAFDVQLSDGSFVKSPDINWVVNESTRHGVPMPEFDGRIGTESYEVMHDLELSAVSSVLSGKGDGRSDGSINLFLGKDLVEAGRGAVVIQKVHHNTQHVSFVVLSGPLQFNATHACLPGKMLCFGDGYFLDPAQLIWDCAWWAGGRAVNGHVTQPMELRVQMGYGWDQWWLRAKARYDPLIPIVSVPLPSITLDKLRPK